MGAFAETAEAIAATRSKTAKVSALAAHLARLDAARLPVATRYFSGLVFPTTDGRTLSVGWAALRRVLLELTGVGDAELFAVWSRHADIGETAEELFSHRREPASGVDILDVDRAFTLMASAGTARERTVALASLLRACTPLEAKYVTKLIAGEMRIGLREGLGGQGGKKQQKQEHVEGSEGQSAGEIHSTMHSWNSLGSISRARPCRNGFVVGMRLGLRRRRHVPAQGNDLLRTEPQAPLMT